MPHFVLRRLEHFVSLDDADRLRLSQILQRRHTIPAKTSIATGDDDPATIQVILSGWACRYRCLADGRRAIVTLLLPGETYHPHGSLGIGIEHPVRAITDVVLGQISGATRRMIASHHPKLDRALACDALAVGSVQREWTMSLGCRSGIERLAHLCCELSARLAASGSTMDRSFPLPLTQGELGEALGQTPVHINRILQDLRGLGLITLRKRHLTIADPRSLAHLAQFDDRYLHLHRHSQQAVTSSR